MFVLVIDDRGKLLCSVSVSAAVRRNDQRHCEIAADQNTGAEAVTVDEACLVAAGSETLPKTLTLSETAC